MIRIKAPDGLSIATAVVGILTVEAIAQAQPKEAFALKSIVIQTDGTVESDAVPQSWQRRLQAQGKCSILLRSGDGVFEDAFEVRGAGFDDIVEEIEVIPDALAGTCE